MAKGRKSKFPWLLVAGGIGLFAFLKHKKAAAATTTALYKAPFDPMNTVESYRAYYDRHNITQTGINHNYDMVAAAGKLDDKLNSWPTVFIWTDQV